jgi:hypothetical protein
MRQRLPLLCLVGSVICVLAAAVMWARSYSYADDVWCTGTASQRTVGFSSTRGQLALIGTSVEGPGEAGGPPGLHYTRGTPLDLRTMGWPVDYELRGGGFLLRRFRSFMTSDARGRYTVRWTTIAVPYWFAAAVGTVCSAFAMRSVFKRRRAGQGHAFTLIQRLRLRWPSFAASGI